MKRCLLICCLLFPWKPPAFCQSAEPPPVKFLFRLYDDNDFLNVNFHGTDKSYTNGVMLDIFFTKNKTFLPFHSRTFFRNEKETSIIHGWSLAQLMFTPEDLSQTAFQPDDYCYSGALMLTRSITFYNKKAGYSLQTGFTAGIRGPQAMAEGTQKFVHSIIRDESPQGWRNQLQSYLLLNISISAEKHIARYREILEVIGGTEIKAGSMLNALSVYPIIRFGHMRPHFGGILSQFLSNAKEHASEKFQLYFVIRPEISFIVSNALIQGKVTKGQDEITGLGSGPGINHFMAKMQYGIVISYRHFALSYTQKPATAYRRGFYSHNVGNLSLYFGR